MLVGFIVTNAIKQLLICAMLLTIGLILNTPVVVETMGMCL